MIKIKKTTNKIGLSNIQELESYIQLNLPESYKKFLLEYNGGIPDKNVVKCNRSYTEFMIKEFFGIGGKEDLMTNFGVYSSRLPDNYLPIASVEGGNLLCLNLNHNNYGYIYFWDHEEVSEESPTVVELEYVTDSFDSLLNLIKSFYLEDSTFDGYKIVEGWVDPEFIKKIK